MAVQVEDAFGVFELVGIGCDCNSQRVLDFRQQHSTAEEALKAAEGFATRNKRSFFVVLPTKFVQYTEGEKNAAE